MTVRVVILENPLDPRQWEEHEVEDLREFLVERFTVWPETARLYDMEGFDQLDRAAGELMTTVLAGRDITPRDEAGVERLADLPGPFIVAVAPADPITAIIAVVAVAVGVAAALFLMPKIPEINNVFQSPNNTLSDRTNQARPEGRIPDIFGTVRSTPDLLAVPYKVFDNNLEVEVSYLCVGRGSYDVAEVRDGDTLISEIAGSGATFYGPGTSPNGGTPQLVLGSPIGEPVYSVGKMNEVNGQVLKPTNSNFVKGDSNIRFVYPDQIQATGGITFDDKFDTDDVLTIGGASFGGTTGTTSVTTVVRYTLAGVIQFETYNPTAVFAAGQFITLANAGYAGDNGTGGTVYVDLAGTYEIDSVNSTSITLVNPATVNSDWGLLDEYPSDRTEYRSSILSIPTSTTGLDLNGTYTVLSVTSSTITLSNPSVVNSAWNNLDDLPGNATEWASPSLSTSGERWIGPFVVDVNGQDKVLANFVGLSGLYRVTNKGKQYAEGVGIELELTPVDSEDVATGPAETFTAYMYGSGDNKESVGYTLTAEPSFTGRMKVRARRTTPTDYDYDGTIVDEVKWRDCYGLAPVEATDFGDVTTVHVRTYATAGATSVKDRKFNLKATRKLPERVSGSTFTTSLVGTDRADAILSAICLDPYIGNYALERVDFDNIYDTIAEVESYFGSTKAVEFGYTFDDDNLSFEETLAIVANCCFCSAYRQGSLIRITFERATEDSVLLFNHRNILPRTQNRSVTFGVNDDHDGIELKWTSPKDGATLTYDIPYDRSALSPRKVEFPGIRSGELAYWHAWRAWLKLKHQSVTLEQECTQEAALVLPSDRVLITDQTRPPGFEGEVLGVDGLDLLLSQPTTFATGVAHTIFIQHIDATVEALPVTAWTPPVGWDPASDEYPAEYRVTLGTAPRLDLAVGEALSARPTYEIVAATDARSRAYLVTEREPQSNFTEVLRVINYSPMYYINDQIVLWLSMQEQSLRDQSPWQRDGVISGTASVVNDTARGKFVYAATGTGAQVDFETFTPSASYTKALWIKATSGGLLTSTGETFALSGGNLIAGHGSTAVSVPAPSSSTWTHVAVAYDGDADVMELYLDGELVDEASSVARGTLAQLVAFDDLVGRADDLRLWKRALSSVEIRTLFRSTQRPTV